MQEESLPDVEELTFPPTGSVPISSCLAVLDIHKEKLNEVLQKATSRKWIGLSSTKYEVVSLCNRLVLVERGTLCCVPLNEADCDFFFGVYPENIEEAKRFVDAGCIANSVWDAVADPETLLQEMCIYLEFDSKESIEVEHAGIQYTLKNTTDVPVQLLCYEGECLLYVSESCSAHAPILSDIEVTKQIPFSFLIES